MEDTFCLYEEKGKRTVCMKKNVNERFARWKTHFVYIYEEKDKRTVCKMEVIFCLYI